uniref:Uncharacterized protein n=1 Tax=Vitis vinifera TaxID=29760 RepID=A5BTV7_VITVI|nr:hypothetical protein VITISV_035509 [Vitis vinifera]
MTTRTESIKGANKSQKSIYKKIVVGSNSFPDEGDPLLDA